MRVTLAGKVLGTYSTADEFTSYRVPVRVARFAHARTGRLVVTVTSRGKPVTVDGFYLGS